MCVMTRASQWFVVSCVVLVGAAVASVSASRDDDRVGHRRDGKHLFERETFGGNGRTCRTCHSEETGTVSPRDAMARFRRDPGDSLFVGDGSDDGKGHGITRMLTD